MILSIANHLSYSNFSFEAFTSCFFVYSNREAVYLGFAVGMCWIVHKNQEKGHEGSKIILEIKQK
jgi:hypothetical protein